jgi:predicted transcriptional regulator
MKTPVITINPNSSVIDAMETMQQKDIRRLPVVDNKEKLLGIVTDKDIFRVIVQNQQTLASGGTSDQILVDQQSIYGKFTDYWLRGLPVAPKSSNESSMGPRGFKQISVLKLGPRIVWAI